jgi:ADP-ribose pyrophosphatase YjhB (NUDIX family)
MTDRSIPTGPGDAVLEPTPVSRAEAAAAFAPLLVSHEPFFDHEVQRPQGRMRVRGYTAAIEAPDILVSAARAVVFRGRRVVVLTESDGVHHVMPGGRREAGESQEATVRRELLEECGWHVGALQRFAFLHFRNAGPSSPPDGHDFVNVIYLAECAEYDRRRRDRSQGEVRSRLMSARAAFSTLADRHRRILAAALSARGTLPS